MDTLCLEVRALSHPRQTLDPHTIERAVATLQQRIDQLQMSLQQQQKLATLGMVTAVIAHEFNNILTPMISYTQYALSNKSDDALRTKALSKALAGSERLANISKSLLGFARTDDSVSVCVKTAVAETLACLSRDLSKDAITLTIDIPENLSVAMNAGQFQQVLMNLVVNARAALLNPPPGQKSTSKRGGLKRLSISAREIDSQRAEVRISDTGPGIPADVLPRIFDPFFSTKTAANAPSDADDALPKGGTGLGLTICQELLAASGGTISAENNPAPAPGATFILTLPLATES